MKAKTIKQSMRLASIVLALCATLGLTSCSKESMLEGTWRVTSATIDGYAESDLVGRTWTFNDGGSCTIGIGDGMNGTWNLSGSSLTINVSSYYGSLVLNFNVGELKSKSMSLSGTYRISEDGETDSGSMNLTFSK